MPGPRYYGVAHRRVVGDIAAAQPYWGYARKLLGAVLEDAEKNNLGVHVMKRRLPDGAVVIAEKLEYELRMTVIPPTGGPSKVSKFKTRAFVLQATRVVAVDLEEYEVRNDQIHSVKEINEVVEVIEFGQDDIYISASIDGSYYRPKYEHGKDLAAVDYYNNTLYRILADGPAIDGMQALPASGSTELTATSEHSPTRRELYCYSISNGFINVFDADTYTLKGTIGGALAPNTLAADNIAVTPDGNFLFSPEFTHPTDSCFVSKFDTATFTPISVLDLVAIFGIGIRITALAPSPDGKYIYGVGWIAELASPIPGYADIVSVVVKIDADFNTLVGHGFYAHRGFYGAIPKVSRDGKQLIVVEPIIANSSASGRVYVIDTETFETLRGFPPGDSYRPAFYPAAAVLAPDDKKYYVAGHVDGTDLPRSEAVLAICDYENHTLIEQIPLGESYVVHGMAMVTIPIYEEKLQ